MFFKIHRDSSNGHQNTVTNLLFEESTLTTLSKTLAYTLQQPFFYVSEPTFHAIASKKFNTQNFMVTRIFFKALGIASLTILCPIALLGSLVYKISDVASSKSFTYAKGDTPEIRPSRTLRMLTLNACMMAGGLPYFLGGVTPASHRIQKIANKINKKKPDIFVLQEMAHGPSRWLENELRGTYSHFFYRIGPNPPLMESGLFVGSKLPILNAGFIPFENQFMMIRGAFWVETENAVVFTTHLEHGETNAGVRKSQLNQILAQMEGFEKPCFLLGDLNTDRLSEKQYEAMEISKYFVDPIPKGNPTCSESLEANLCGTPHPSNPEEQVDYALLKKPSNLKCEARVIETYKSNPYAALSDHKALEIVAQL